MPVCDTCGLETDKVYRVVVDSGYDRSTAPARYNCRACFERKDQERAGQTDPTGSAPTPAS